MQVVVVKENPLLLSQANCPLRADTSVLSAGDSPQLSPSPQSPQHSPIPMTKPIHLINLTANQDR